MKELEVSNGSIIKPLTKYKVGDVISYMSGGLPANTVRVTKTVVVYAQITSVNVSVKEGTAKIWMQLNNAYSVDEVKIIKKIGEA